LKFDVAPWLFRTSAAMRSSSPVVTPAARGAAGGEHLGHDPSRLVHLRGLLRRLQA
jgi:hypothetical protein